MKWRACLSVPLIILAVAILLPVVFQLFVHRHFPEHASGVIIVTGAKTGIGRYTADHLASLGGYTVFAGVRAKKDLEGFKASKNLIPIHLDVTDEASIEAALKQISEHVKKSGRKLIGLVNNAGISGGLPIELIPMSHVKSLFDVNLFGVIRATQAFLPLIREAGGRIINIGSVAGWVAPAGHGVYCGTKAALEKISDALRREVDQFNVSVSVVEPGYITTNIEASSEVKHQDMVSDLTSEERELYGGVIKQYQMDRQEGFGKAESPRVITEAIMHAMFDPYPRTRYAVGPVKDLSAKTVLWVASLVPDRLLDMILED